MAAGFLRVDPAKLRATASSFEGSASTVQNLTQQMTDIVTSLSGNIWSGDAATAYVSKFNGLQDDMTRIYKMVKEHSEDLITIAQSYETAENENMAEAGSLSEDVIV